MDAPHADTHSQSMPSSGGPIVIHGSYKGHALAGAVFIIWGIWTSYCVIGSYLLSSSYGGGGGGGASKHDRHRQQQQQRRAFRSRAWYALEGGPGRWFEPAFKLVMGLAAVCVELRFAAACHVPESARWAPCWPLYAPDGHFDGEHMNNWHHALMYVTLAFSGAVDLLGLCVELPEGSEHAAITFGFLSATLVMGLHAKHVPLDQAVHSLLTLAMAGATVATAAEALLPHSFPLAAARAMLQLAVGAWFVQIGRILFLGSVAWEPTSHAAGHMVPAVFVGTVVAVAVAFLGAYLVLQRAYAAGLLGWHAWLRPQCGGGGGGSSGNGEYGAVATADDGCGCHHHCCCAGGSSGSGAYSSGLIGAGAGPFEVELGIVRGADCGHHHSRCDNNGGGGSGGCTRGWRHGAKRGDASVGKARFSVGSSDEDDDDTHT